MVGVARDTKAISLNEKPVRSCICLCTRITRPHDDQCAGDGRPVGFGKAIEKAIHELNAELLVFDVTSLELRGQFASFRQRVAGTFVGAFGLLALALAAVGIYGVTAYTTRQRTHEIGIRMALGATKQDVLRLVLSHGIKLMAIGVCVGLVLSLILTRFLTDLLLGVTSTDALTFASVAILLCAATLLACFIPARRAMRVDPHGCPAISVKLALPPIGNVGECLDWALYVNLRDERECPVAVFVVSKRGSLFRWGRKQ